MQVDWRRSAEFYRRLTLGQESIAGSRRSSAAAELVEWQYSHFCQACGHG